MSSKEESNFISIMSFWWKKAHMRHRSLCILSDPMDKVSCTTCFRVDWYIARAVWSNKQWRRRPVLHVWYIIRSKNERKTYYWWCFITACRVVHIWYSGNTSKLFPFCIQIVFVFLSTSHITLRQSPIIIWILFHENVLKFTLGRDAQS